MRDDIGLEKLARRKTHGVIFSKSKIKKNKKCKKSGAKMERAGVEFFKKKHPKVKRVKEILPRSARSARSALEAREAQKWGSGVSPSFLASARKFF